MKRFVVPLLAFVLLAGINGTESFARGGSFLNVPSDQRGLTLAESRQRELRKAKERKLKDASENSDKRRKSRKRQ